DSAVNLRPMRKLILVIVLGALAFLNLAVFSLPNEPDSPGSFADVGDGRSLHFVRGGSGIENPIVFVHGLPGTWADFKPIARLLDGRNWIAFDRPGFGASAGGTQSLFDQAESIRRALDSMGIDERNPVTMVGHSYGGSLSLALAESHPKLVKNMVLLAPGAGGKRSDWMDKANARMIQVTHLPVVEQINDLLLSNIILRTATELQEPVAFSPHAVNAVHKRQTLEYTLKDSDLLAMKDNVVGGGGDFDRMDSGIKRVRQQVVVLHGRSDKLIDFKYAQRLVADLPNGTLVELRGGHMIPYTHAREAATRIRAAARR
ncbi:MAG: alpha/beta hydrolase, partial [Solirubrobacterales bacterium]